LEAEEGEVSLQKLGVGAEAVFAVVEVVGGLCCVDSDDEGELCEQAFLCEGALAVRDGVVAAATEGAAAGPSDSNDVVVALDDPPLWL
jgi:hypothetical protein